MPDFNAKMHRNRFRLRLRPRPAGELTALPRPLVGGEGREEAGRGGQDMEGQGMAGQGRRVGGAGGSEKEGWVGGPLCEILNTPLVVIGSTPFRCQAAAYVWSG